MIIAVMNYTGNVGKTTIARHVLMANMPEETELFTVESINSDGTEVEPMRGEDFAELQQRIQLLDNAVVDVGQSNVESFVSLMKAYHGSHEDYDLFLIPTTNEIKQQRDTVTTILHLSEMGVDKSRIRVVLNMVDRNKSIEKQFEPVFNACSNSNSFVINKNVLYANPIFDKLGSKNNINSVLADTTNYKSMIRESDDESQRAQFLDRIGLIRLARGIKPELDSVFNEIVCCR